MDILLPRRLTAPIFRGEGRVCDLLVIHCAATQNGDDYFEGEFGQPNFLTPIQRLDAQHKARGFQRSRAWLGRFNPSLPSIGYHYLIYLDGTVVTGRHLAEVGAHAEGWNSQSVGICLLGTDAFTEKQWVSLAYLVGKLETAYANNPNRKVFVRGHRDLPEVHKSCPGFSVDAWLAGGRKSLAGHVWPPEVPKSAVYRQP
jgi:hypothetical protein